MTNDNDTPIQNVSTEQATPVKNVDERTGEVETKDVQKKRHEKLQTIHRGSEEKASASIAKQYNLPYLDLNIIPIDVETLSIIPEMKAKTAQIAAIHKERNKLQVAITDPLSNNAKAIIEWLKKEEGFEVTAVVVSPSSMKRALDRYKYVVKAKKPTRVELTKEELEKVEKSIQHLEDLQKKIGSMPVTEALNTILAGAIKIGASDIHLEPEEHNIRIRYRLDGVLHDVADIDTNYYKFIVSRIKILSKLKLNVTAEPQDGRFSVKLTESDVDIRVSIIPGNYGESIVMRLLSQGTVSLNLEALGFEGRAAEIIQGEIKKPTGMILTTGPTGSGKTTTLYAFINNANNPETKIITLEDPIEYKLEGIQQTQIEKEQGYTFADGLRAILRQDPDVIMVGEIRDLETAEIAIHASLTGHVVFSTLHTNSADGAIPRLLDMGIQPAFVKPAINAIIGQRLVRKLCENCREEYEPATETLENMKKILAVISPKAKVMIPKNITTLYRAHGCEKCNNTGYKGRIGIYEVLTLNSAIEKLVLEHGSSSEILGAAIEDGMVTMLQDGILKAVRGTTSMDEVYRVLGTGDALTDIYENILSQTLQRGITITEIHMNTVKPLITDFKRLHELFRASDNKTLPNLIIAAALEANAGDIHLEPEADDVKIRFRIDGILQEVASIANDDYLPLIGNIKMMSGFKTDSDEVVQDGRFSIDANGENVDARISIIKGGYGDTAVIRVLKAKAIAMPIEELGFRKSEMKNIAEQLSKPNGMLLTTGPTGSGKTTTLYAFINHLNTPENKIITIEDPIEYRLKGILQTQTNEEKGYTFANALRALLRQNPNIIMVGEIRDQETGEIATQAALTGHLLLSTLHSNNAAGAFQRLVNMGINTSDLAAAINAIIAQRLVRKLCDCKSAYKPTAEVTEKIAKELAKIPKDSEIQIPAITKLYRPKGCAKCNNIGYKGIVGIYELLEVTKEIEEKIMMQAPTRDIEEQAQNQGMITLSQDGYLKALRGVTSYEEILRVTKE